MRHLDRHTGQHARRRQRSEFGDVGAGAELRQTLGTAVFSGMIGVTVFGLIFTPVFYVVTRWLAERTSRMKAQPAPHPAE